MIVHNLSDEEKDQLNADKEVCQWLNDKRDGKITREDIKASIVAMPPHKSAMYQNSLRHYGQMFEKKD